MTRELKYEARSRVSIVIANLNIDKKIAVTLTLLLATTHEVIQCRQRDSWCGAARCFRSSRPKEKAGISNIVPPAPRNRRCSPSVNAYMTRQNGNARLKLN
jgi:hypothetical protein